MNKLFYVQVLLPEDTNWTILRIVATERQAARNLACKMGLVGLISEGSFDDLTDNDPVYYPSMEDYEFEVAEYVDYQAMIAASYKQPRWQWLKFVDWPSMILVACLAVAGLIAVWWR